MPNVIREDVVQVSFRSDGVSDMLRGEDALSQIQVSARSAGRALSQTEGDVNAAGTALSQLRTDARTADSALSQVENGADNAGNALSHIRNDANEAGTALSQMRSDTRSADSALSQVERGAEETGTALTQLRSDVNDAGAALSQMQGDARNASTGFSNLTEEMNQFADALERIRQSQENSGKNGFEKATDALKNALSSLLAIFSARALLQNVAEYTQALNKLEAQTGATASEMESMGEAVKTIYTSGIGESLGEVADTAALVNQQFKDLDTDTMQNITQSAMTMADTFGTDVNETLRGVNALMVNMGLTAEEAFDYIAKGTQNGLDKSGELSDNIAEYSQLWAQAGFSAEEMFTVLQNGLDSGAYNLDKVNDFVKEFTISLSDGRIEENIESFSDRTQTLFAQWQNGTASQKDVFQSVINDLSTMTNQQEALTLASTVWSALGEDNAMQVITSLNNVNDTYNDVKGTMESINDIRYADIGTSFEQLKRSASGLLTETLTPAVTGLNGLLSAGLESLTAFASEHAALAQGMAVAATAAGVLTVGLIAVSGAIGVVKTALDALNVSSGGVLKVVGLVVAGVSVLAGVFAGLHAAMADDEVEDYAGTLSECRTEIEQTELALKKARERYGENSAAVKSLESDLELLNAQYEKGGGAVAEYAETATNAAAKLDELAGSERAAMEELDATNTSGYVAISMLEALSDKANLTNADLDLMSTYANYLNDTFDCNIQVNYDTGKLTGFDPQVIATQIASMYKEKKISIAMEAISGVDFVDNYKAISDAYEDAAQEYQNTLNEYQKDADAAYQEFIKASDAYANESGSLSAMTAARQKWEGLQKPIDDAAESLDTCKAKLDDADATLKENCDMIDASGDLYEIMKENITETSDALSEYGDANEVLSETEQGVAAAQDTIDSYSSTLQELCIAYDEARTAALESIQSQFNLWDEVEAVAATSTDSLMQSIQSQTDYWTQYNDSLSTLQERSAAIPGLADMLLELNDGSAEAASALAGLAGASDTELQNVVTAFLNLQQQEQDTSDTMGDVATQFSTKTGEMKSDMEDLATSADMSAQFGSAATSTINAYFDSMMGVINDRRGEVESALASLSSAISSASSASSGLFSPISLPGHASGTTDAEDVFVAGERGAELVIGKQGSTVFPASETEKIIRAVQEYTDLSGGYQSEQSASYRYDSQMTTMLAPTFQLYLSGGMSGSNQRQAKQWMQQIVEEMFAGVLRTNPPVYTI